MFSWITEGATAPGGALPIRKTVAVGPVLTSSPKSDSYGGYAIHSKSRLLPSDQLFLTVGLGFDNATVAAILAATEGVKVAGERAA